MTPFLKFKMILKNLNKKNIFRHCSRCMGKYLQSKHLSKTRLSSTYEHLFTLTSVMVTVNGTCQIQFLLSGALSSYRKSAASINLTTNPRAYVLKTIAPNCWNHKKVFLSLPCFKCRTLPDITLGIFISFITGHNCCGNRKVLDFNTVIRNS